MAAKTAIHASVRVSPRRNATERDRARQSAAEAKRVQKCSRLLGGVAGAALGDIALGGARFAKIRPVWLGGLILIPPCHHRQPRASENEKKLMTSYLEHPPLGADRSD